MTWAEDVRRAHDAIDWIEARQGPLPPTNYATIETTVGQVRALREAGMADDERTAVIRRRHQDGPFGACETCDVLARVAALEAERDALRARAERAVELCDDTFQPMWFESVPSGVRWFCGECQGVISGFGETEQAEADAAMQHQQTCRWVFAQRIRAALAAAGEGE